MTEEAVATARFVRHADPDARALADIRARYDGGLIDAAGIAVEIGFSISTVRKRLREWGWRKPKPRKARARSPARDTLKSDATRLRKVVRDRASRHTRELERRLRDPGGEEDVERIARTLASLVKTLAELARSDVENGSRNDRGADGDTIAATGADMARIRSDLVDRLVAAAASDGDPSDTGHV